MLLERKQKSGEKGRLFKVDDTHVRDWSKTLDGGNFTPKNFRTMLGTTEAIRLINSMPAPTDPASYETAVWDVGTKVARLLGNEAKMAIASYISPTVWAGWKAKAESTPMVKLKPIVGKGPVQKQKEGIIKQAGGRLTSSGHWEIPAVALDKLRVSHGVQPLEV